MPAAADAHDVGEQHAKILVPVHEVDLGRVHHQQRRRRVMVKELGITVNERLQIRSIDPPFIRNAATANPLKQHIHRRLQINYAVGGRQLADGLLVHLLIQSQLIGIEVGEREQSILLDQKVTDKTAAEQLALLQFLNLPRALKQKKQLRRQRELFARLIKALEKRIFLRQLE